MEKKNSVDRESLHEKCKLRMERDRYRNTLEYIRDMQMDIVSDIASRALMPRQEC